MRKNTMFLAIAGVIAILLIGVVSATDPSGLAVDSETDKGEYVERDAGDVDLEAGNITNADLSSSMSTYRWSGLYGDVEGTLYLGDSNNDTMINWTAEGRIVFASNADTISWSALANATYANVIAEFPHLAGANDADNYNTTFTGASENIGSDLFPTLQSDYAYTTDNETTDTWKTYSLTDGAEILWAGAVIRGGTAYTGETVDYQMIIPEDGTGGTSAVTTYYLWAELQ